MMRRSILLALIVAIAVAAGACGKKGKLETPEGSQFPRTYPTQ